MAAAMIRSFKEALHKSLQDFSRPSFMDRMSGMRREGRRPVAALYAARGRAYRA